MKKAPDLANKDDASRLVHHLINRGVLRLVAQRMERKQNQNFVNTQQSVDIGPEAAALNAGRLKVTFAVKVCPFTTSVGSCRLQIKDWSSTSVRPSFPVVHLGNLRGVPYHI